MKTRTLAWLVAALASSIGIDTASASQRPTHVASDRLPGNGTEFVDGLAISAAGLRAVCGTTTSTSFATAGAADTTLDASAGLDAFVALFPAEGDTPLFVTYLGGSGEDFCARIAFDASGDLLVTGYTTSADFPTVNAFDDTFAGSEDGGFYNSDVFLARIAGDGSEILFSTYLGGTDINRVSRPFRTWEFPSDLQIGPDGRVYVVGETGSPDFPVTASVGGRACMSENASQGSILKSDGFISAFSSNGELLFSTCFGGDQRDALRGIEFDSAGRIVVAGFTRSADFPLTPGAVANYPPPDGFTSDVFVTVLDPTTSEIVHSARLGGYAVDTAYDLALDSVGNVVVVGSTTSAAFPVTPGAFQLTASTDIEQYADGLLVKLSPDLSTVQSATYLGEPGDDLNLNVFVDAFDQTWVASRVGGYKLNVRNEVQADKAGDLDFPAPVDDGASGGYRSICHASVGIYADDTANIFDIDQFVVLAGPGPNRLYRKPQGEVFVAAGVLAGQDGLTTAVACGDLDDNAGSDIVVFNEGAPDYWYRSDGARGLLQPVELDGLPDGVASAALGINGDTLVVSVPDSPLLHYVFDSASQAVQAAGPLGEVTWQAHEVRAWSGEGIVALQSEQGADNVLRFYRFMPGGAPVTQALTYPFAGDVISLTVADFDSDNDDDVIVLNGSGQSAVIRVDGQVGELTFDILPLDEYLTDATSAALTSFGLMFPEPLLSVGRRSGAIHHYRYTGGAGFELRQTVATGTPGLLVAGGGFLESLILTGELAPTRFADVGPADLFIQALSADSSARVFASYLGGAGDEVIGRAIAADSQSRLVVGLATAATHFPLARPGLPLPFGGSDTVLATIELPGDDDGDGVPGLADNCVATPNPGQIDSDQDGLGNACDADFNNDQVVNLLDLIAFKQRFGSREGSAGWDPRYDLISDGVVNLIDLIRFKSLFGTAPGGARR